MKVLVLLAHGSRVEKSNQEVAELAAKLDGLIEGYDQVASCFLELTAPKFDDTLNKIASEGAKEIVVFPYFLAEGRHVRDDVPEVVERFKNDFPNISIELKPYLGMWQGLAEFISKGL